MEALNRFDFVCCVYDVKASFEKMGSVKESRAWLHIRDQGRLEGKEREV